MRKALLSLLSVVAGALSLLTACGGQQQTQGQQPSECPTDSTFVIEGKLPAEKYDSCILYLVPMLGAHPRPVDSVFVAHDGSFRFEGNVEQMAVLRLEARRRYGIQELLVVTEPGMIHVTLDSISSSYGTPQNDTLQAWKERLAVTQQRGAELFQLRAKLDTVQFSERLHALRCQIGEQNYCMLKGLGRTTLSTYIFNNMMGGELDSLRRQELSTLLLDTTDYSLPQPGFHR